ncbi:GATA zinc finger domain-containing protein 1-like [Monodelphis domestica]|uniref:GATA zinc finger domain-containing protein 1-like n=1 Tax=Monodelphis domestica TaxID=13616 RepID=UPI000443591A|nr:GATA zinc finger domain-containing protein 1-like [Monodelphis domestica]
MNVGLDVLLFSPQGARGEWSPKQSGVARFTLGPYPLPPVHPLGFLLSVRVKFFGHGGPGSGFAGNLAEASHQSNGGGDGGGGKQEIHRRSARLRNTKYKSAPAAEKKESTKGKGRRHIFKLKNPIKAPEAVSTIITAESIFHKGMYYQIGDVVSVVDEQDGKTYYAQIRGFIQDQYCEKSAALTWLILTLASPKDQFDPASYIIGPEEDLPRKMEYLEFVCHAPSEYFKSRSSPFPTVPTRPENGYIWTHVGPTPAITIKETVANNL